MSEGSEGPTPGKPVAFEALAEELREEGASSAFRWGFISCRIKSLINPYLPSRRYLRLGAECPDTPSVMIDFLKIRAPFRYSSYCLNIFANISAGPLSSSADGPQFSPPRTSRPISSYQPPGRLSPLFGEEGGRGAPVGCDDPSLLVFLGPGLLAGGRGDQGGSPGSLHTHKTLGMGPQEVHRVSAQSSAGVGSRVVAALVCCVTLGRSLPDPAVAATSQGFETQPVLKFAVRYQKNVQNGWVDGWVGVWIGGGMGWWRDGVSGWWWAGGWMDGWKQRSCRPWVSPVCTQPPPMALGIIQLCGPQSSSVKWALRRVWGRQRQKGGCLWEGKQDGDRTRQDELKEGGGWGPESEPSPGPPQP